MHKFVYIATLLLLVCLAAGVSGAPKKRGSTPAQLDCHNLPFGQTEAEVLSWLELYPGVSVSKDESISVHNFTSYQPVAPFFSGGIRKNEQDDAALHNRLVKKYVVKNSGSAFPTTFRTELYFVRGASYMSEYRLFVLWCMSNVEAGKMKDIYTEELEKRINLLGIPDNIWEATTFFGTYRIAADSVVELTPSSYTTSIIRPQTANVTLWQMEKGAAFFMMTDNGMLQFKEYLFVCSDGWGSYLKALAELQTPLSDRFIPTKKEKPSASK